jgi:PAS domain-containing protein
MSFAVNSEDWTGANEMLTFLTGRRKVFLLAASAAFLGAISFPEGQPTPLLVQFPWVLSLALCALLAPSQQSRINVPAAVVAAIAGSVTLTLTIAGFGDPSGMTAATLTLLPLLFLCVVPDEPLVSISSGVTALLGVSILTAQGHFGGPETLLLCAFVALIAFGSARLYRHERHTDLAALREAVDQQHRLEARWQTLSEASSDAILLVDVSADQVLAANRVASDWFGRKDTIGWRLSPMLREDGDDLKARCEDRIPWGVQGAVITAPSGETFAGDLRVYPVEDGDRLLVAVIIKDATQRLRQLKEREKTNRLAQVGTVATGIVHEINNPLSFMMANLYYLEDALNTASGITPPPRSTLIEVIKDTRKGVRRI